MAKQNLTKQQLEDLKKRTNEEIKDIKHTLMLVEKNKDEFEFYDEIITQKKQAIEAKKIVILTIDYNLDNSNFTLVKRPVKTEDK